MTSFYMSSFLYYQHRLLFKSLDKKEIASMHSCLHHGWHLVIQNNWYDNTKQGHLAGKLRMLYVYSEQNNLLTIFLRIIFPPEMTVDSVYSV